MTQALTTLTDFEVAGLNSVYCLADGHAYQDIHPAFEPIIEGLPEIWRQSAALPVPLAEKLFNAQYAKFIQSAHLSEYAHFRICPTASNTIDIIAAVLKEKRCSVTLIEPAFDNLSLLLKRRGLALGAINDHLLFHAAEHDQIEMMFPSLKNTDALFIVTPNNPTGLTLSEQAFRNILCFCEKHGILLVIDNCFRIYKRQPFDDYKLLLNSSVSFMAFEDSGKVWPTQDLKTSLVYFSKDLANLFNEIYNEVYLCVSNFSLGILSSFFQKTALTGVKATLWDIVDQRRALLRSMLEDSLLQVPSAAKRSTLPVEWLSITDPNKNDYAICHELRQRQLAVLPGRQFFWQNSEISQNRQYVRVSLMKKESVFMEGIDILQGYINQMTRQSDTLAYECG